jgi:hypothetical protein
MGKYKFCEDFVRLDRAPLRFDGRPYLPAIYEVQGNLVIRASRQVEKSTFLANTIIYEACRDPLTRILFVSPRAEQAGVFSNTRLVPLLHDSPVIRRHLLGKGHRIRVRRMRFSNGAQLNIQGAFRTADASRGISANLLMVDEVQDIAPGDLPVLMETLSHATNKRVILTGTPKMIDNQLESYFNQSTANVWTMACPGCGRAVVIDERSIGPVGLICPDCQAPVDATAGCWVPRNPGAAWGAGFAISHPMVPWLDYEEILERQRCYDPVHFRNEVLGLPTTLGEHIVTRSELEQCCTDVPLWDALTPSSEMLFAGIDWGGGMVSRTVLVIGAMRPDFTFVIRHMSAFHAQEDYKRIIKELVRRCRPSRRLFFAADRSGNGHIYNRMLYDELWPGSSLYAIQYSNTEHEPVQEGVLRKWTVNRSASIGVLFGRIKRKQLLFPRLQDVDAYLDEFACETAVYDDKSRSTQYTHPDNQRDDFLHATNYALLLATRIFHQSRYC